MSGILAAVIIIVLLGILITVHELGHYLAAKACGVRVREFAIGMGPAFFTRQKKDAEGNPVGTKFTLRVFPIGGFCDLSEDEAADESDPEHFRNKTIWQKIFILAAGSIMNVLLGFLFFLVYYSSLPSIPMPDVLHLEEDFPYAEQIQVGDRFRSINGHRIHNLNDFHFFLNRTEQHEPNVFIMERDGERFTVENVTRQIPVLDEDGIATGNYRFGFNVLGIDEVTFPRAISHAATSSVSYVRLIWYSLGDLITGRAGLDQMMGPVGMGGLVNDIITDEGIPAANVVRIILNFAGLIAVNLAVVNMLPIPALDGGRIVFLFISKILLLIRKKPLNAKVEGYIHGITMLLLFALMIIFFYNDIRRLIGW